MAIYMNYNKLAIKGNVTAKGYEDWIELDSVSLGCGRGITMEVGNMAN
ncbi:MAG: type VI secretion system tube protein Hcp, partial [Pseudomonadota bacterium]|nr:type VI secretion system tube protein Hcp [Pseudomonadota bacterium]